MSSEPITVLIVDDHYVTRLGLKVILRRSANITIIGEAESGPDGIEQALSLKPHVVIMDIGLPGMNGIEAAKELKLRSPEIKILIMSTRDDENCILDALSTGADGYCLKDAAEDQIVSAVTSVALGAGWLHPQVSEQVLLNTANPDQVEPSSNATNLRFPLSAREREVLHLIVEGMSNQEIAQKLGLSSETVKTHVRHMMEKLMVSDRTQAAVKALREGLLSGFEPNTNKG